MKSRNIVLIICFILLCTSFGLYSGYRMGIHYSDKYENILDTEGQYILSTYDGGVWFAIGTSDTFNNLTAFLDGPVDIDVFFKSDLTLLYAVSEELLKDALSIYFIDEQGNLIYETAVSTVSAKPFGNNYIIELFIPRLYKM